MRISRRHALSALLIVALSFYAACSQQQQDESAHTVKRFPMRGEVTLLIPSMQRVVVRHETIEGWSLAANMEYAVRDPKILEKLAVGDQIRAAIFVLGRSYWLGEIEVVAAKDHDRPKQ